MSALFVALLPTLANAHGHIVWPPARNNGTFIEAGNCHDYECFWFSQPAVIPGKPTLPDYARTLNIKVNSGPDDFSAQMPWRAPGTAPTFGSGCGAAGGGPVPKNNGGIAPPGIKQNADFLTLPAGKPTVWTRGSIQEAAWAIFANHGGGYSWRLCKKGGNVTEDCFLKNTLQFDGEKQWIRYPPIYQWGKKRILPDFEIPAVRVIEGTHPAGAMWTRNPVPACHFCDQTECMRNYSTFDEQQHCSQSCSGLNVTGRVCPPGMTQFPEPLGGISGYYADNCGVSNPDTPDSEIWCDGLSGFEFSIVDRVKVPMDLPAGDYLLSWRWDCEQSRQIWENCADVTLV